MKKAPIAACFGLAFAAFGSTCLAQSDTNPVEAKAGILSPVSASHAVPSRSRPSLSPIEENTSDRQLFLVSLTPIELDPEPRSALQLIETNKRTARLIDDAAQNGALSDEPATNTTPRRRSLSHVVIDIVYAEETAVALGETANGLLDLQIDPSTGKAIGRFEGRRRNDQVALSGGFDGQLIGVDQVAGRFIPDAGSDAWTKELMQNAAVIDLDPSTNVARIRYAIVSAAH